MRILILSPTVPAPPNNGTKIRIYNMIKSFSKGNEITFVGLVHEKLEYNYLYELKKYCKEVYIYPRKKSKRSAIIRSFFSIHPYRTIRFENEDLRKKIEQLMEKKKFDLIWVNFLNMVNYLRWPMNSLVVLDQHNADELMWKKYFRHGDILQKIFAWWNIKKLRNSYQKYVDFLDVILSVSKGDADFTRGITTKNIKIWVVPNGVDISYFKPRKKIQKENIILFCGSMDVTMNIDAVFWITNEIFPLIKNSIPNAKFWIVGRSPSKKIKKLEKMDGVKVTGTVKDVRPYYDQAKVFIAPFKLGGGTKLKVLEAMSMELPVVSTSVGCQGIDIENGKHALIEKNTEMLAERIIQLLDDVKLRHEIAKNGKKLVEERYSWNQIYADLKMKLKELT